MKELDDRIELVEDISSLRIGDFILIQNSREGIFYKGHARVLTSIENNRIYYKTPFDLNAGIKNRILGERNETTLYRIV